MSKTVKLNIPRTAVERAASQRTATYVQGDDWCGLYIDGVLKLENHSLDIFDVLKAVSKLGPFKANEIYADLDWLDEAGSLPANVADVRSE